VKVALACHAPCARIENAVRLLSRAGQFDNLRAKTTAAVSNGHYAANCPRLAGGEAHRKIALPKSIEGRPTTVRDVGSYREVAARNQSYIDCHAQVVGQSHQLPHTGRAYVLRGEAEACW